LNRRHIASDIVDLFGLLTVLFEKLPLAAFHVIIERSEILLVPGVEGFAEHLGEGFGTENVWNRCRSGAAFGWREGIRPRRQNVTVGLIDFGRRRLDACEQED
jgi:hypothetical protein